MLNGQGKTKSFSRRSTLCRGVRSNERNYPPVAASNLGLGYQNGKTRFDTERNFALSTGPKIRLSDPAGTMPTSGEDILQVIYWQEIRLLKGDCK